MLGNSLGNLIFLLNSKFYKNFKHILKKTLYAFAKMFYGYHVGVTYLFVVNVSVLIIMQPLN